METALQTATPESLAGVFDFETVSAPAADPGQTPALLIEVPHGATLLSHFVATRRRLVGAFPRDLEQFFFVNTDVGSIECARLVARMVTSPDHYPELSGVAPRAGSESLRGLPGVLILRGLVPRTFIDCNRVIRGGPSGGLRDGMTPGLPEYVNRPEDVRELETMHAAYQDAAVKAYESVLGIGGAALILHTYAPRSIRIDRVDAGIVSALRRAYEPPLYESWDRRPDVDLISESADGTRLAPERLVQAVRERYRRIGIEVAENATYRLHEDTMGYVHSSRYPGHILCMELNRELLADPFTPFEEMTIGEAKARRMAAPIAEALLIAGGV